MKPLILQETVILSMLMEGMILSTEELVMTQFMAKEVKILSMVMPEMMF